MEGFCACSLNWKLLSFSVFLLLNFLCSPARSATIENNLKDESSSVSRNNGTGNSTTLSKRNSLLGLGFQNQQHPIVYPGQGQILLPHQGQFLPMNNLYFSTPASLYETAVGTNPPNSGKLGTTSIYSSQPQDLQALKLQKANENKKKEIESENEEIQEVSKDNDDEASETENKTKKKGKTKRKTKRNKKKTKNKEEEMTADKIESKTESDEGIGRGCPACITGTCDATLDPSTNISGIPLIQILIAIAVGAFWVGIFIFFLVNFIEHDKDSGGYGYGPPTSYGTPHGSYGAPVSSYSGYSTNRYGRSKGSSTLSFNDVSDWVWNGIDKMTKMYDNKSDEGGTKDVE